MCFYDSPIVLFTNRVCLNQVRKSVVGSRQEAGAPGILPGQTERKSPIKVRTMKFLGTGHVSHSILEDAFHDAKAARLARERQKRRNKEDIF